MVRRRPGGIRRLALLGLGLVVPWTLALWLLLPYDSSLRLALRFAGLRAASWLQTPFRDDKAWLLASGPAPFPVDLARDVALVVKTGYGTRGRVPAQLEALGLVGREAADGGGGEWRDEDVLIIGDFAKNFSHGGRDFEVYDMVAPVLEGPSGGEAGSAGGAGRIQKYKALRAAIEQGDDEEARNISRAAGWELDAMKFIAGLELVYRRMPGRKWYLMVDDDTYIIRPSLRLVLGHVDPSRPVYLGNAVGDFKGRFAHGGSSFLVSLAAMRRLFEGNPEVVRQANAESLTETWGDKLVATTLIRVGVYLDERFSRFFNGEQPAATRILADRFCSPLVSFHGLADPVRMAAAGRAFRGVDRPVFWSDLWRIYGRPGLEELERVPVRAGEDHVGVYRVDEHVAVVEGVTSAERCLEACQQRGGSCLAWTWVEGAQICYASPWVVVGEDRVDGGCYSGVNVAEARALLDACIRKAGTD